ncbi:MAG: heavy metal translocating P-type ATPase [Clostridia bacterium]|nr:heavy metal translocating P-type ATPase [Clostridia bacterium]
MKNFEITGMSCAACSARVEKAVSAVDGVSSCSVNLLTNSMSVDGTAPDESIKAAVVAAGYGIKSKERQEDLKNNGDGELKTLKNRLIYSSVFLLILVYISMGHNMWGFPLPAGLTQNPMMQGLLQFLLTVLVLIINRKFFISGTSSLLKGAPNMDTLVALGSGAAFAYSTISLFSMSNFLIDGDLSSATHILHGLYFESSAMILTLITVGKMLETRAKGKTAAAIKSLIELAPKTAVILKDGKEVVVAAETLKIGDIFVVRPGERIATDGTVIEGESAVDESILTGESIPVDKACGDFVTSATINKFGFLKCEVTKTFQDNTLSQIIKLVSDTTATKAPIAKAADKVSGVFVPIVIAIAFVSALIWLILGKDVGFALARGISVLVISCPCALGLATPVAIMVGSGVGAKNGILFKNATALENLGKTKIAVLDKTGTITKGKPEVTDVVVFDDSSADEFLKIAASLEQKSEHPLAKAVVEKAKNTELFESRQFEAFAGNGVSAEINGKKYIAGSLSFVSRAIEISKEEISIAEKLADQGKTPMLFARETEPLGIIAVADEIKEDSPKAVDQLKKLGIKVVMLTGDNKKTADAIAGKVHITEVVAGVLPDDKADKVRELMSFGKVMMVGDGINDAPSLATADTGVAIGTGADVAVDAADVVLVKSSLMDASAAVRLSRSVLRNIHQNLFWAFLYNTIGIPLAAGAFISIFGWELNPMFGAAAMSLSSFSVVSNALRLNFVKINKKEEKKAMKKTIKIEGMMCPHCEANVKNTLETIQGVTMAEVSHKTGTAVVESRNELSDDLLKKAIEDKGYKVLEIQ